MFILIVSKIVILTACDESLFARNGSLSSPHFPKPYPGNKDCRITITAEPDYVVQIYFTEFEVEFHEECKYDYVLVSTDHVTHDITTKTATDFTKQRFHVKALASHQGDPGSIPGRGHI